MIVPVLVGVIALLAGDSTAEMPGKSGVLVTAPNRWLIGANERICITVQNLDLPLMATIKLLDSGNNRTLLEKQLSVQKLSDCYDVMVSPYITGRDAMFNVLVYRKGYKFEDRHKIGLQAASMITFIQTDKPVYKPGQDVKFRILSVMPDLKPRIGQIEHVYVEDPNGARMEQWNNISITDTKGLGDFHLEMSPEPVQGIWKITAILGGTKSIQTFTVKEYVLPKYEITVKPPSYIMINDKNASGQVCAQYTYGEPVKGELRLSVCARSRYSYGRRQTPKCIIKLEKINGCYKFTLPLEELGFGTNQINTWGTLIYYNASVVETGTGVSLTSEEVSSKIENNPFKLDFRGASPTYFKPGLTYHGKMKVTRPDGTPAGQGEVVKMSLSGGYKGGNYEQNFTTDSLGEINFGLPIPVESTKVKSMSIQASMPKYDTSKVPALKKLPYYAKPQSPNAYHSVKQWYSPSGSHIQFEPILQNLDCDATLQTTVKYTVSDNEKRQFYFQVVSGGDIVHSGSMEHTYTGSIDTTTSLPSTTPEPIPEKASNKRKGNRRRPSNVQVDEPSILPYPMPGPNYVGTPGTPPPPPKSTVAEFSYSVPLSYIMSGSSTILVYYVLEDGEVVADSQTFQVQECVENHVSLEFMDAQRMPGEKVEMILSAEPGSLCSLGVVDKSIQLMGQGMQLTLAKVFKKLKEYDVTAGTQPYVRDTYCQDKAKEEERNRPTTTTIAPPPGQNGWRSKSNRQGRKKRSIMPFGNYYSEYLDSLQAFKRSGIVVMGDVTLETRPCESAQFSTRMYSAFDAGIAEGGMPMARGGLLGRSAKSARGTVASAGIRSGCYGGHHHGNTTLQQEALLQKDGDGDRHQAEVSDQARSSDLDLETRPCERRPIYYYMEFEHEMAPMPGGIVNAAMPRPPGAVPGPSGAAGPVAESDVDSADNAIDEGAGQVEIRDFFPETWLWELHTVGEDGELMLEEELPDTITEWVGSAFCTNAEKGLGVSETAGVTAFQPFFVSFTLPYSIIRGEKVRLPVTVFNYMSQCIVVELNMKDMPGIRIPSNLRKVELCVCGQESVTHKFRLEAEEIGKLNITVFAKSIESAGVCGNEVTMATEGIGAQDAVIRELLVEPEGKEVEKSYGDYICPAEGETVTVVTQLQLPHDYVEDSGRAFINVIGDVMGPSLSGLDKLLKLPTGCGEQNMLKFAPNVFVMQYLTATGQLQGDIKSKALGFLKTGYQRELTYRHDDGSFSAFGKRDDSGSMWLTAFVVKSFAETRPYITIDEHMLNTSVQWFKSKQEKNGCFPQVGRVIHKDMKGGLQNGGSPVSLTAYVLIAMLEAGLQHNDPAVVSALRCLDARSVPDTDLYTTALLAYAYSLYNPGGGRYEEMIDRLYDHVMEEDGLSHWEQPEQTPPTAAPASPGNGWVAVPSHRVHTAPVNTELTAYALMAFAKGLEEDEFVSEALPIVRWLSKQRNAQGGFGSTQDTVVGLQSLALFATEAYGDEFDITVHASTVDRANHTFSITSDTSLLLQQEIVTVPNNVTFTVSGEGCAFVQTNLRYNIKEVVTKDLFQLQVSARRTMDNNCRRRDIRVCASYLGSDGASNMAVVSVKMVTGWVADKESLEKLTQDTTLQLKRFELNDNHVDLYFDELVNTTRCFMFAVDEELEVENPQPSMVTVYDYYDTDVSSTVEYAIKPYCGTKEEIPFGDYDDDGEGIEQKRVRPTFPRNSACPHCSSSTPDIDVLHSFVCDRFKTYRGYVRRNSQKPLRITNEFKEKTKLSLNVVYTLPEDCQCGTLTDEGASKVLILTDSTIQVDAQRRSSGTLSLGYGSKVVPVDRTAERALKKKIKNDSCGDL